MQNNSFFRFQYLFAAAVVACSLALGALVMGALVDGPHRAEAADAFPKSKKEKSGHIITERVSLPEFDALEVSSAIDIILTQGDYPGYVEVSIAENMRDYLNLQVEDSKLTAGYKNFRGNNKDKTEIKISVPAIYEMTATSASSIKTIGSFAIDKALAITATSAADINIGEITGESLVIEATSAADVYALVVDVDRLYATATSAADIKLRGLNVGTVSATATSAADITLSGRCNHSSVYSNSGGDISTRGLIREKLPIKRAYATNSPE